MSQAQQPTGQPQAQQDQNKLSTQLARRGIEEHVWNTVRHSCFPKASNQSVLMYFDYCRARTLDPLKKPAHIFPILEKDENDNWTSRDIILPGIYEYRTTASRTGEYMGHSVPEYGPLTTFLGVEAPEWCSMTMYRLNSKAGKIANFPVKVYFAEAAVTKDRGRKLNAMWTRRSIGQLTKCTEAAGLREAFPEELGGEPTFEEMAGQHDDIGDPALPEDSSRGNLQDRLRGENAAKAVVHAMEHGEAAQDDSPNEPEPQAEPSPEKTNPAAPTLDDVLAKVKQAKATEDLAEAIADSEHLPEADVEKVREAYRAKVKDLNQANADAAANAF